MTGPQFATLTVTSNTTSPAVFDSNASIYTQPLDGVTTIQIIRTMPAGAGNGSRTNLLTLVIPNFTDAPNLAGSGNSATFSASTPTQGVTFSSDFISFNITTSRNLSFSFSGVNPALQLGAGNFLNSFTAAGSGTFASDPVPVVALPSAAGLSVGGRVLTPQGRGISNALVEVTDLNGDRRAVRTNSFGYFRINEIEAGQTYVFNVLSKSYNFSPQVLTVSDDLRDLNFTANP